MEKTFYKLIDTTGGTEEVVKEGIESSEEISQTLLDYTKAQPDRTFRGQRYTIKDANSDDVEFID